MKSTRGRKCVGSLRIHTEECTVTACRTAIRVRKGGGFFYGKSSNENHTEGI